jgi:hypothetical protein
MALLCMTVEAGAGGIWISPQEIRALPVTGPAWDNLKQAADTPTPSPRLSDQDDPSNVRVLAKALVYARTGQERYRQEVIAACRQIIGTELGGRTLALGRELAAYVIAADLVSLPAADDQPFRQWLRRTLDTRLEGKSLRTTHERRPNNWGTAAGASRAAIAAYLDDADELARTATVFKGWLGDRDSYNGFRYRDLSWQADPTQPVAINPQHAEIEGHDMDGALPEELRRSGAFRWPPPRENYVWTALQGALVQAEILHRAGYPAWEWEDRALLRTFRWLHEVADYPARGDDTWQPHIINHRYQSDFPAPVPSKPGKIMGWSEWTHGRQRGLQ